MSLDDFVAGLSLEELAHLLGGQPNLGVANTWGIGNLPEYSVPNIMTADGPAGLRLKPETGVTTTAFPTATLLCCTWNPEITRAVGEAGAREVKENNLAMWLTPAVNIHRNPLCGRNFEYYSEDPLLAGRMAAAMVEPLEQVVDDLKEKLRLRHILRLQRGECSIEAGFVWSDLLTDLERVADHCSNIAGCVLEMRHERLDLHGYLGEVRTGSAEYAAAYENYARKYSVD